VTVGLPVYNGEDYLEQAIQSILKQTFGDFELIISDNASTDRTQDICEQLARIDPRIRYVRLDTNCGAARNYQRVFHLSRSPYFKWAAHDDVCLPGFLKACLDGFDDGPASVVLVYPRSSIIDASGVVTRVDDESIGCSSRYPHIRALKVIRNVNLGWAQFGLHRAEVLRRTRLIDSFIGSDYVLLAELAMLGLLREIPDVLFQRRIHEGVSNVVHTSRRSWLTWLDPSQASRSWWQLSPAVRVGRECARSARRLPLRHSDRILCGTLVSSAWFYRKLYQTGSLYKERAIERVRRGRSVDSRVEP
jgi:glycosyltransferase involved in cell wall biosynthesis